MKVPDLCTLSDHEMKNLHHSYRNGLYYFGAHDTICVITQNDYEVLHHTTRHLNRKSMHRFVYPDVINFLPGGLSISFGTAYARWELLKCFDNSSATAVQCSQPIPKKVGYNRALFHSLEQNWSISTSVSMATSYNPNFLIQALLQKQFQLPKSYGGTELETSQEDWREEHTANEEIALCLAPRQLAYISGSTG